MGKISEKIRQAMQASGQSLNAIARETNVDNGTLSRFMRAERTITVETAERLAEYLGLELSERAPARKKSGRSAKQ